MLVKLRSNAARRSIAAAGAVAGADVRMVATRAGVRARGVRGVSRELQVLELENLGAGDEAIERLRADPDVET